MFSFTNISEIMGLVLALEFLEICPLLTTSFLSVVVNWEQNHQPQEGYLQMWSRDIGCHNIGECQWHLAARRLYPAMPGKTYIKKKKFPPKQKCFIM